jgi:hypothetical protein
MATTRSTLVIGDVIVPNLEAIFLPESPHDRLGPPGHLTVPVYLKAIFGRDLHPRLRGLEPPEGWSPP